MGTKPTYEELEAQIRVLESKQNRTSSVPGPSARPDLALDFQRLADRSQDAIYHLDLDSGKFLFLNQKFITLFGLQEKSKHDLSAGDVLEGIHPEDRGYLQQAMIDSTGAEHSEGEAEYRIQLGQGPIQWLHDRWIVIRAPEGRARAVEGFIRETTTRRLCDLEIEASKQNAPIGSYIVQNGLFRFVNPEFTRITGYEVEELLDTSPLNLVHEDYRSQVREMSVQMFKGARTAPYEFCIVTRDGDIRWIMETVTSIQYGGRRAGVGYFLDVTPLRSMQHNLSSLGLMIGAVSHSLKNCLTGLEAGLYLVDTGFYRDKPARIEEGLDAAKLMVDRLKKLVYDVLYSVKERELDPACVQIIQFINDVAASLEVRLRGADIDFVMEYSGPLGEAEFDPELMRTALINIIENAMEACIEDQEPKAHRIEFLVLAEKERLIFEIADNGPGMTKDQRQNAFQLFYSSKGRKGTGLGLYITKKVIQQHGGSVTVESSAESGTRFTIVLPRKGGKCA